MRRATSNQSFIFGNHGQFLGVALGYDFCSEHEHGVSQLKSLFGVSFKEKTPYQNLSAWYNDTKDVPVGLVSRKVNYIPKASHFKLIEFYAVEHIWPQTKTSILTDYPNSKKALNAKVKHAILIADVQPPWWLSAEYTDPQGNVISLKTALEDYKVGDNHYVLDKSIDAMKLAKALQNARTYLELSIRGVWEANAKGTCLADWNNSYFMATAWDDSSFGIHVKTEMYVDWLKQLFHAFMQKNICIIGQVTGNGWNRVGGLVLGVYDQLFSSQNEAYVKSDNEQLALAKAYTDLNLDEIKKKLNVSQIEPIKFTDEGLLVKLSASVNSGMDGKYYLANDIINYSPLFTDK